MSAIIVVALIAHHIRILTLCNGTPWINIRFSCILRVCISTEMKPSFIGEQKEYGVILSIIRVRPLKVLVHKC
jgi:hypothetical protein